MTIIGLAGYAQSGKDTVGNILVEKYGFERIAFADALRDCLYALNPIVGVFKPDYYDQPDGVWTWGWGAEIKTVQQVVDKVGWDAAKVAYVEIRALLQRLGTEVGRQRISDNVWVDAATREIQDRHYWPGVVFTDVRFPNEAQRIKDLGGEVWRVDRTGTRPVNAHPSETALDEWVYDYVVFNTGTLEDLDDIVTIGLACAEDK